MDITEVICKVLSWYYYVIQIDKASGPLKTRQYYIHKALKCSWRIAQPKGKNFKFKKTVGCTKCSTILTILIQFDLPVATGKIQCAEPLGPLISAFTVCPLAVNGDMEEVTTSDSWAFWSTSHKWLALCRVSGVIVCWASFLPLHRWLNLCKGWHFLEVNKHDNF